MWKGLRKGLRKGLQKGPAPMVLGRPFFSELLIFCDSNHRHHPAGFALAPVTEEEIGAGRGA
jgi:hypothetical protein